MLIQTNPFTQNLISINNLQLFFEKASETLIDVIIVPRIISHISDCIDIILKNQSAICIADITKGEYYLNKYLDPMGNALLEIIDTDLYSEYISFRYEYASPFVEKFNMLMERIIESGIVDYWMKLNQKHKIIDQVSLLSKMHDPFVMERLSIILFFGFVLAIATLFFEILFNKYF